MTAFKLMAEIFDLPKAGTWAHIWTLSLEIEKIYLTTEIQTPRSRWSGRVRTKSLLKSLVSSPTEKILEGATFTRLFFLKLLPQAGGNEAEKQSKVEHLW